MSYVFVLDTNRQPLMPCHPARAKELLTKQKAAVYRRYPFTIILKDRVGGDTQPIEMKNDPGSKATGLALVVEGKRGRRVVWGGEITHKGQLVVGGLESRSANRHSRRARHTRYRPARFSNRRRGAGWLPPSLRSRIDNVLNWTKKVQKFCPLTALVQELVRFDMQALENPEIDGVEYQQGTLLGYEVRGYLLEKWQRTCTYCGKKNVPMEIEHIIPKARGGSNRVSNLALACHDCNNKKGTQTAAEFGHPTVQAQAKRPLKDAAAVNATRWALYEQLAAIGLPLSAGTGGRTKYNRTNQQYPKAHWIDAACAGVTGEHVHISAVIVPLRIRAMGRGSRQMCSVDKYGFPRTAAKGAKRVQGFQTGDIVKAIVPSGVSAGTHTGRITIRSSGRFNIGKACMSYRYCVLLQHTDGYAYQAEKETIEVKAD